jgi:hypothetical protein
MATKKGNVGEPARPGGDAVSHYGKMQVPAHAAICDRLRAEIDAALPKANSKIWHAIPVWLIGDNPVVGYKAIPKYVNLLFWNGQSFGEPDLTAAGKFRAAQIQFSDVGQNDLEALRRWLRKAGTDIWDSQEALKRQRNGGNTTGPNAARGRGRKVALSGRGGRSVRPR